MLYNVFLEKYIQTSLKENDFYIYFEEVDDIPPTASGKPQIIQSFLEKLIWRVSCHEIPVHYRQFSPNEKCSEFCVSIQILAAQES